MKQKLINFYLEYINEWLTVRSMAEYYEISVKDCSTLIEIGKRYNEQG